MGGYFLKSEVPLYTSAVLVVREHATARRRLRRTGARCWGSLSLLREQWRPRIEAAYEPTSLKASRPPRRDAPLSPAAPSLLPRLHFGGQVRREPHLRRAPSQRPAEGTTSTLRPSKDVQAYTTESVNPRRPRLLYDPRAAPAPQHPSMYIYAALDSVAARACRIGVVIT